MRYPGQTSLNTSTMESAASRATSPSLSSASRHTSRRSVHRPSGSSMTPWHAAPNRALTDSRRSSTSISASNAAAARAWLALARAAGSMSSSSSMASSSSSSSSFPSSSSFFLSHHLSDSFCLYSVLPSSAASSSAFRAFLPFLAPPPSEASSALDSLSCLSHSSLAFLSAARAAGVMLCMLSSTPAPSMGAGAVGAWITVPSSRLTGSASVFGAASSWPSSA
mmetsp:Transcript_5625/g.25359  ORF Transcript_5625/g.25359 Transcript_5625/m.25359 type:complete len:223 (-) Transcript_5625:287-955(-)